MNDPMPESTEVAFSAVAATYRVFGTPLGVCPCLCDDEDEV